MRRWLMASVLGAAVAGVGVGCRTEEPPKPMIRYPARPPKEVPAFLKGTVYEATDLEAVQPFAVSGWGLVVNLRGTGDSTAPTYVREFIIREMIKHGFGMKSKGMEDLPPERVLHDPSCAIVRVDGLIPPGTRKDQQFDVYVSALPGNNTTSLSHGQLYQMELRANGADTPNPAGNINVLGRSRGDIFINPAYALISSSTQPGVRESMRSGVILNGGLATNDWPLLLRLRQPEWRLSRALERRIDERFQEVADVPKKTGRGMGVGFANDEGIVSIYVPKSYRGDWEHFAGLVTHLYLDGSPANLSARAKELAAEAVKPDAPLMDISYCWEGIGQAALPFVQPLMTHSSPEVAFAAARAAAFLGDSSAHAALARMAATAGNPFQLGAVRVLGKLPNSQSINEMLRRLLNAPEALVRIEAYQVLAGRKDPAIYSKLIGEGADQKFVLDLVPSDGPPLVFATRSGTPRIAIIGRRVEVVRPVVFTAFEDRLSITSSSDSSNLTIYFRGRSVTDSVKTISRPDLAEVAARLGGETAPGEAALDFSYGDVVGILQAMGSAGQLTALRDGQPVTATFMLQETAGLANEIAAAPVVDNPPATGGGTEALPDFNATGELPADGGQGAGRPQ